jgi:hypothetical protein
LNTKQVCGNLPDFVGICESLYRVYTSCMQAKNNCMKKILFIISIIFFQCSIYGQDYIKFDSLKIDGKLYKMKHLSFGNSSGLKLFKVITCEALNSKKIEQEIINCHRNLKLEFTEFYVISIPTYEKVSLEKETNILTSFLNLSKPFFGKRMIVHQFMTHRT